MAGNDKQTGKQGNLPNQGSNQDTRQGNNQSGNPGNQGNNQRDQNIDQPGNQGGTKSGSSQSDTSARGFASMDPDRQREIASEGGRAAHAAGTAHEFTSQEARAAGKMSHKNDQQGRK